MFPCPLPRTIRQPSLLERLVWTHVIERRQPILTGALLCNQVVLGAIFEVKAHIDVHAFVRSMISWTSGPASQHTDPERYPEPKALPMS